MYKFLRISVIALALSFVQSVYAERLTDQVAIETLKNVRNLFFSTKEKVIACVKSGGSDQGCFCENKKYYIYLNKLADQMFKKYPNWSTAFELRYIDGETVKSVMPQELKRQMTFKQNCISYILL